MCKNKQVTTRPLPNLRYLHLWLSYLALDQWRRATEQNLPTLTLSGGVKCSNSNLSSLAFYYWRHQVKWFIRPLHIPLINIGTNHDQGHSNLPSIQQNRLAHRTPHRHPTRLSSPYTYTNYRNRVFIVFQPHFALHPPLPLQKPFTITTTYPIRNHKSYNLGLHTNVPPSRKYYKRYHACALCLRNKYGGVVCLCGQRCGWNINTCPPLSILSSHSGAFKNPHCLKSLHTRKPRHKKRPVISYITITKHPPPACTS